MSTENELFAEFRAEHVDDGLRWREYWRRYWMDHVHEYFERNWWLVPCGKYSKRPLAGWKWSERRMDPDEVIWYAAQGMNIAVVAQDLVILDYDTDAAKPFDTTTLTMKTAKGYQYWCQGPFKESQAVVIKKLGFDVPRSGQMFALVPLSRTCRNDRGGKCPCLPAMHDYRIREWLNFGADPKPLKYVLEEIS